MWYINMSKIYIIIQKLLKSLQKYMFQLYSKQ